MEQKRSGDTDALSDGSPKGKSRKTEPEASPKRDVIDQCTGAESDSDCQPSERPQSQEDPTKDARKARIAPPRDVITVWGDGGEHLLTMALSPGKSCLHLGCVLNGLYDLRTPEGFSRVHWEIAGLEGGMYDMLPHGDYQAVQCAKDGPSESECIGWDQMCNCVACQVYWLSEVDYSEIIEA